MLIYTNISRKFLAMKVLSESEQNLKETKRAFSEEDLKRAKIHYEVTRIKIKLSDDRVAFVS